MPALLTAQQRRAIDLQFLLDPNIALVQPANGKEIEAAGDLPQAIGLKFRYLRLQIGLSVAEMARQVKVRDGLLSDLELGRRVPLVLYMDYLEALSMSWSDFVALEVPPKFDLRLEEARHLQLRLCPHPDCPNHQSPSRRVILDGDRPERRIAHFYCQTCGRRFTRAYDGELKFKLRKPLIHPGEPPPMLKSAEEIARLKDMGLRGEDNRQIAHWLGWSEKTVRIHWISLGLEEQVHQAQARRRAQEQQQRSATRRARVEAALQTMLDQDEEITFRRVGRALGYGPEYVQTCPELARLIGKPASHTMPESGNDETKD